MNNPGDNAASDAPILPLNAGQLYRRADPAALSFASTAELEPANGLAGQQRALDAISFGTKITAPASTSSSSASPARA